MHYLIQDTIFNIFLKTLLKIKGLHTNNIYRIRMFIEAVYFIARTGSQWRMLPWYYDHWRAVHKRFKKMKLNLFLKNCPNYCFYASKKIAIFLLKNYQ